MASTLNSKELIESSLRLIQQLGTGESLPGVDYANGIEALNMLLSDIEQEGALPIKVTTEKIDMVSGTKVYNPNSATIEIVSAFARDGTEDTPIEIISAKFYDEIREKSDDSDIPRYLFFEKLSTPQITVWPQPNDSTIDVYLREIRSTTEVSTSTTTLDLPDHFHRALKYLLAADLGEEYGTPMQRVERLRQIGENLLRRKFIQSKELDSRTFIEGAFD